MKNKYIKEMDSIHASDLFKEEMIEKMNSQVNQTNIFSLTVSKVSLAFVCVCLCIVTTLSIKNYLDMQALQEQLASTKKTLDKILYQTNNFNRLMDRNYEIVDENEINPSYYNPFDLGGMGSGGDIFPGISANSDDELVKEEDISLEELNQMAQVPLLKVKESIINHKDKIELLNQFIDIYENDGYQIKTGKDYLQFVGNGFYITIYDTSIELEIDKNQYTFTNNKEASEVVKQIITDFEILFPKEYEISINKYEDDENYYVTLYENSTDDFTQMINHVYTYQSFSLVNGKNQTITLRNEEVLIQDEYPMISYEEALNKLKNNESYAFDGVKEYLNYNRIANVKLHYFFDLQSETHLPYYEFLIEVDYDLCKQANYLVDDGLKYYGSVYVPAISEEYIEASYDDVSIGIDVKYEDYVDPNWESVANEN